MTDTKDATNAQTAQAKRVVTLDDIKYNDANKVMAILSVFGLIGLIVALVEKDDLYVKYHGYQFGIFAGVLLVLFFVPLFSAFIPVVGGLIAVLGGCINFILALLAIVAFIIGLVKVLNGERFDMPVFSDIALKMLNK